MKKERNLKKIVTLFTLLVSFLLVISSNFGIVKADDCFPACLIPDAFGDTTTETMVGDLQEALNSYPYYDLSGIDVTNNQTQYQRWDYDEDIDVVSLEFEYIGHDAGHQNVMGYYFDSDINSFVGVFEIPDNWGNDHSGYDLPIASEGDKFTVNNIPKSELGRIGFGIDSENGGNYKLFSENDLNPNDKDRALVFTLCDDVYGLIYVICFEDLRDDSHKDFYDACAILRIIECDSCIDAIDDIYDVNEGESLNIDAPGVLDNDINSCGGELSVELISGPNFDLSFTLYDDGSFDYFHDGGESIQDSFVYEVSNDNGANDQAIVNITINPINDPPQVTNIPNQNIDEGDTFNTINLDNYVTDIEDPDPAISWTYTDDGNNPLTIDITNRIVTITPPNPDWYGQETINFIATDTEGATDSDTATFTINPINDPPQVTNIPNQNIDEGDTFNTINLDNYVTDIEDPDPAISWTYTDDGNNPLTIDITNRIVTITPPNPDWYGQETINFIATDTEGATDSDTATFTIGPINDPPEAIDDSFNTDEDTPITYNILINDFDLDGILNLSSITIVDNTINGNLEINNTTGLIKYIPNLNFYGNDGFNYTVEDDLGATSNIASVRITVESVNDPPTKPINIFPIDSSTDINLNIILSWFCSDVENDTLSFDLYFGSTNPPTLLIQNISDMFYPVNLEYLTTYYWKIVARDIHNNTNSSDIWSFTTKQLIIVIPPPPDNQDPVADASAGEPYNGFVGEEIIFDGTKSYDQDENGFIWEWIWDFGDGEYGRGETTNHTYMTNGTFEVNLTVNDNLDGTDFVIFDVEILKGNNPPTKPVINGHTIGKKNKDYEFSVKSSDLDNDTIQYVFDWGDGEETVTEFLPNESTALQSHNWTSHGTYIISVYAYDNYSMSETTELTILIDILAISGEISGNLIEIGSDETYDMFESEDSGVITDVDYENKTYLIDIDSDNKWDYTYNDLKGILTYYDFLYQKYYPLIEEDLKALDAQGSPGFEIIMLLAAVLFMIIIRKRKK